MRITTRNFQSIQGPAVIDLEGLTVVLGESNRGKSALIRSIIAAISNPKGHDFLPSDADVTDILLENDGHSLQWTKGLKGTSYKIDGKDFLKAGKSTPADFIAAATGIYPLLVQGKQFYPQIQSQHDGPFLLNESDTTKADLLSSTRQTQIITTAIKLAREDLSKKETEVEIRDSMIKSLQFRLEGVDSFEIRLQTVKAEAEFSVGKETESRRRLETLQSLQKLYNDLKFRIFVLKSIPERSLQLPTPTKSLALYALFLRWGRQRTIVKAVSVLRPTINFLPVSLAGHYNVLRRMRDKYEQLSFQIKICSIQQLDLSFLVKRVMRFKNLIRLAAALKRERKTRIEVEESQREVERGMQEVRQNIESCLQRLGRCPMCGQLYRKVLV